MEKQPRSQLVIDPTRVVFLLILPILFLDFFTTKIIPFGQWIQYYESTFAGRVSNNTIQQQQSTNFLLSSIVTGNDRKELVDNGFACHKTNFSIHCVTNLHVRINTSTMTLHIASDQPVQETIVRPYARQEDRTLLKNVTPVKILQGNYPVLPDCQYVHNVPAVIFSSSGFVGNVFHEFNEIIIPLYITSRHLSLQVKFLIEDYKASFVRKYNKVLSKLSAYEVINPLANQSVHCFLGAIVGLKFQSHLALNSSDTPGGYSMLDFKQFLRQAYGLKFAHVSQINRPNLALLSRRKTRRFLNEDKMISMMEELGFRVNIIARSNLITNLDNIARVINSCSVLVGTHGAGLTNELFLPSGAVMVQVELIGLEWAGTTYYGDPAAGMGLHYMPYRIEPEESSLWKVFRQNYTVLKDTKSHSFEVGREIYLNHQNVRINLARFRETMVEALSIVGGLDV